MLIKITDYPPTIPLKYADYIQQEIDKAKERCEKYLKNIATQLTSKGLQVRTEAIMGEVSEEIITTVRAPIAGARVSTGSNLTFESIFLLAI